MDALIIEGYGRMRFSDYFELNRSQPYLDFVDIRLDTDISVFIDPTAIRSLTSPWGNDLSSLLQAYFQTILRLIKNKEHAKAVSLLSCLNERNEFHLGYSRGASKGHGFGNLSATTVWDRFSKSDAATTGLLKDLEDTILLIHGVGKDMISDAVCNILNGPLIKYTQDMCFYYGIPMTPDMPSGPIWNPKTEAWEETLLPLPTTSFGNVILVPKVLVRQQISYQSDKYYRHHLIPAMQAEHIQAGSSLVKLLKDGTPKVSKVSLLEKYGASKLAVVEQTEVRPEILERYKQDKDRNPSPPLTLGELSEILSTEPPSLKPFINRLKQLPSGREHSGEYENLIEKVLSVIFYPSLINPKKQDRIHQGRKRVDITYTNEAKEGFFYWASMHYPCSLMFVECKNYGKEMGNPEIDQLTGRFSPSRGQVGLLICRSIENRNLMTQRCVDTAKDQRGFILTLDDQDIIAMINEYHENPTNQSFPLLRQQWSRLIK